MPPKKAQQRTNKHIKGQNKHKEDRSTALDPSATAACFSNQEQIMEENAALADLALLLRQVELLVSESGERTSARMINRNILASPAPQVVVAVPSLASESGERTGVEMINTEILAIPAPQVVAAAPSLVTPLCHTSAALTLGGDFPISFTQRAATASTDELRLVNTSSVSAITTDLSFMFTESSIANESLLLTFSPEDGDGFIMVDFI